MIFQSLLMSKYNTHSVTKSSYICMPSLGVNKKSIEKLSFSKKAWIWILISCFMIHGHEIILGNWKVMKYTFWKIFNPSITLIQSASVHWNNLPFKAKSFLKVDYFDHQRLNFLEHCDFCQFEARNKNRFMAFCIAQ